MSKWANVIIANVKMCKCRNEQMSITPKRPIFQNNSWVAGERWVKMLIQTVRTCTDMSIFTYLWQA